MRAREWVVRNERNPDSLLQIKNAHEEISEPIMYRFVAEGVCSTLILVVDVSAILLNPLKSALTMWSNGWTACSIERREASPQC